MEKVNISTDSSSYSIYIHNTLKQFSVLFDEYVKPDSKIFLITDSKVASIYGDILTYFRNVYNCKVHIFNEGEESKNINTINSGYEFLIENNCDRNSILIALGGGVVGDMVGFIAATFMRGIKYINIPTTLTAQVDSSIGGKVGYNYKAIKNVIGGFYNPSFVFISTHFLKTLTRDEILNGLGEVIKYGLINRPDLLKYLEDNYINILSTNEKEMLHIVKNCVSIKAETIQSDFRDLGLRNILNFGHTVAHAVEIDSNYKVNHGFAVALGILVAIKLSQLYLGLDEGIYLYIINLYKTLGLPKAYKVDNYSSFLYAIKHDKKNSSSINFVLLEDMGEPKIRIPVKENDILWALKCSIDMED